MGRTNSALKQSVELFAKNIFDDPVFQKNWQGYLDAFGNDIANIFGKELSILRIENRREKKYPI